MRKFAVSCALLTVSVLGLSAAEFPYGASTTQRFYTNNVTVSSLSTPVGIPQASAMPASDSVAIVNLENAKFTAMDEETWAEATNAIAAAAIQAAFTLKIKNESEPTYVWMGYSGGKWRELSASSTVAPAEGEWDVKIDLDYSLGSGSRRIRYSIRPATSTAAHTALKFGGEQWIAIGVEESIVNGVDLYGYGTAVSAEAVSGARSVSGDVINVADVSMDYSTLKLKVTNTTEDDVWGLDTVNVVVKNSAGQSVGNVQTAKLPVRGESVEIDLSKTGIRAGESYSYSVSLTGSYGKTSYEKEIGSDTVNLFSSIDWFGFDGAKFVNATTDNISIENEQFFATDDELKGVISPTKASDEGQQTIVTSELVVASAYPWDELAAASDGNTQFAVALAIDEGTRVWAYYNPATEEWIRDQSGIATTNGTYTGVATFDYRDDVKKVSYTISDGTTTKTLASDIALKATRLEGIDIMGSGFGKMNALCKTTGAAPVEPEGTTITLESNSKVDLANLSETSYTVKSAAGKSFHLRWDDVGGNYAKMSGNTLTVVPGTPQNRMKSYDSYVLGLEADDSASKPAVVVKPGVAQKDGQNVFVPAYVPNVEVKTELGHTVQLQLMERLVSGGEWTPSGNPVDISETVNIPIGDNTRLYRVDTIIK